VARCEPAFVLQPQPPLGCAVLRSAVTQARIQGMGTRAVSVELRLAWDAVIELFGSEDAVCQAVEACDSDSNEARLSEAVQLAKRYLEGWRPERL